MIAVGAMLEKPQRFKPKPLREANETGRKKLRIEKVQRTPGLAPGYAVLQIEVLASL